MLEVNTRANTRRAAATINTVYSNPSLAIGSRWTYLMDIAPLLQLCNHTLFYSAYDWLSDKSLHTLNAMTSVVQSHGLIANVNISYFLYCY